MSSENVEVVRRVYDAIAERDSATLRALYHPEIEWDNSRGVYGDLAGVGVYRGLEAVRARFREWYEAWDELEFDCRELVDAGAHVISVVTFHGRGRTSGLEAEVTTVGVWTMRDGQVVRTEWFPTREEALEAAGLSE